MPTLLPAARPLALLLAFAALPAGGCARGVTIDQAFGRPDATTWTYFEGSPSAVVEALSRHYEMLGVRTESVREEGGGVVVVLTPREGAATNVEVLVQATTEGRFGARAQIYPDQRPLPRDAEAGVTGRL